jgi:starch synthase
VRALFATSEIFPLNKTGGLGDVSAWLPLALKKAGIDIRILIPAFPDVVAAFDNLTQVHDFGPRFHSRKMTVMKGAIKGNPLKFYLLDAPELFTRAGNPYSDAAGNPWGDNHIRYAALSWAAAKFAEDSIDGFNPDIIHANDWMTALAPAYLEVARRKNPHVKAGSVLTIHNLAFQGLYPFSAYDSLELPNYFFNNDGLEFYRQVSFLKGGISFADKITTVSPTYALEIQTPEFGCGLENDLVKKHARLTGILNGCDYSLWNPETDRLVPRNYSKSKMEGKRVCKDALQSSLGLARNPKVPLMSMLSRLTEQKGVDIVIDSIPALMMNNIQLVIMGADQGGYLPRLRNIAAQYPDQFAVADFDEDKSHLLVAGSDVLINPARFEPCGLTQMFAMKYGTLPFARRTGGLSDTIIDANFQNTEVRGTATGFLFDNYSLEDFIYGINRILNVYRGDRTTWNRLCRQAMEQDFGWPAAASAYIDIYNTQMELIG